MEITREKSRLELDSYNSTTTHDPFSPYAAALPSSPDIQTHQRALASEEWGMSSANLPLVGNSADMAVATPNPYEDDDKSYFGGRTVADDAASTLYAPSTVMFNSANEKATPQNEKAPNLAHQSEPAAQTVESVKQTNRRRFWVILTWLTTWWIPSFILSKVGRIKRPDIQMAWREKFTIK